MVMFSGFDASEASKAVLKLGGGLANGNRETTHLVMNTLKRTPKLLCCLPTVRFVLSLRWLEDSIQQNKLLDEQPYLLQNTELERQMNIEMPKLLCMPQREQLFKGKTFYISPSVVPGRSVLREIVESSGGRVVVQPKSARAIAELTQKDDNAYVVIACPIDFHLLTDVVKLKIGTRSL